MSHAGHKIVECECGRTLSQCRCMEPNKLIEIRKPCTCKSPQVPGPFYIGYAQDYAAAVEMMFPPLPKLWIAEGDDTYYDSGGSWVVGVFETLEGAKAFCDAEFEGPKGPWHEWNPGTPESHHSRTYTVLEHRDVDPTVSISQIVVRP